MEGRKMTVAEKAWINYTAGDTLWYVNKQGQRYYARVDSTYEGTSESCWQNCCSACECEGMVLRRSATKVAYLTTNLHLVSAGQRTPALSFRVDVGVMFPNGNPLNSDSTVFSILAYNARLKAGSIESEYCGGGVVPRPYTDSLNTNAAFASRMTFNSITYRNVYYRASREEGARIDSSFFNKEYGLIRFTTLDGNAYTLTL